MDRFNYERTENSKEVTTVFVIRNACYSVGIIILMTFLAFLFKTIGVNESNIIVTYILGVLIVSRITPGYFYGIMASILGVLAFNFFFTEPYYSLDTYRADYPVTFFIMLIAAIITSTLTAKIKEAAKQAIERESRTQILYENSQKLIKAENLNKIAKVSANSISTLFEKPCVISLVDERGQLGQMVTSSIISGDNLSIFESYPEREAIGKAFILGLPTGLGTEYNANCYGSYFPITGQNLVLGVVGIISSTESGIGEPLELVEAIIPQIALAVERELMSNKQHEMEMIAESERLRGNLLRSISHDLRTPLTGIIGATATIIDNIDQLDMDTTTELLRGVHDDADWLIHSMENILSITKIDEQGVGLKKNAEALEEIIAEALYRIKSKAGQHSLTTELPEELLMIHVDGILLEQVVVNLLENAIRHTPETAEITVRAWKSEASIYVEVADNGTGIKPDELKKVFDRFYTSENGERVKRRGTGLGLSICKSIIEAHDGKISAYNNERGGATFRIELPNEEGQSGN